MVDKILEGTWAEAMLIGIPALTIVITFIVRVSMCLVSKVKQVRRKGWATKKIELWENPTL